MLLTKQKLRLIFHETVLSVLLRLHHDRKTGEFSLSGMLHYGRDNSRFKA